MSENLHQDALVQARNVTVRFGSKRAVDDVSFTIPKGRVVGLLDNRRGLGFFVIEGAREKLKAAERQRFLQQEWPRLRERLRRLDIGAEQLNWEPAQ